MSTKEYAVSRRMILGTGAGAAAWALAAPTVLRAQATPLRFSSWLPAASLITENLFVPWVEEVAAATEGRVAIEILPRPLGPPPAHLGLLESGEADIAYSLHGYTPDRFNRAKIGQFSFLGDAYSASQTFSQIYGRDLRAPEEHEGVKLLGLFQHGPGVLMMKDRTIRTVEDFRGLRVRTSGGYIAGLMEDLGAVNAPMSPTAVRQALTDGEIDAVAFPYEAGPAFGVTEEITSVSELPNGYYNATWFLGMSNAAAARVAPEDLAILENLSATLVHVLAAKAFDYADYLGKETFIAAGVQIDPTPPAVIEKIGTIAAAYEAEWSESLAAGGFDGAGALAAVRRISGAG